MTDEIFGPVVTVLPFDDEADAIALANGTEYGLSGSICRRATSVARHPRLPRRRERQPLGQLALLACATPRRSAAFKQSGLGRELGPDAATAFTETKNVFIATD